MNTIAVDAMGGDSAPIDIVKGAIKAKAQGVDVVLCGDKDLINPYLENYDIKDFRKIKKQNKNSNLFIAYFIINIRLIDNI